VRHELHQANKKKSREGLMIQVQLLAKLLILTAEYLFLMENELKECLLEMEVLVDEKQAKIVELENSLHCVQTELFKALQEQLPHYE